MSNPVRHFARYLEGDEIPPGWNEWGREVIPSLPETPIVLVEREGELPMSDKKHDAVEHPKHYTSHPSGVECITIVEHFPFNIGAAIKYLWRCGQKGDAVEDLEKARWMITREIERRKKQEK